MADRKPTENQRRFVEAYMGNSKGNATDAAERAGYAGSKNTLAKVGSENLRKPQILEAIEKLQAEHPLVMSRKEAHRILWGVFTAKDVDGWDSAVDQFGGGVGLLARDRLKAHAELAKTAGWNITKHEHSGPNGEPIKTTTVTGPDVKKMTLDELEEWAELNRRVSSFVERLEARRSGPSES